MKIIVSAGGSYGHIHPAFAIIKKFQEKEKDLEILYIGTHNRMEKDLVPKEGIPYESIEIYGFTRNMKRNFKNIGCISKAYHKCLRLLQEFQPDVVIGAGGYVTYPVLKAAHKLHIKTFIHEQNSIPGKTNKVIARYADLIGVTFETSIPYFKTKGKVVYTGHPCAKLALEEPKLSKTAFGLSKGKKLVLIMAGSLGSSSLNRKLKEMLYQVKHESFEILYVTGKDNYEEFIKDEQYPSNVFIVPYVDHLTGLLKSCDVVVSRAGAASLFELIALQIPSIIIPSPNVANNHQYYNAKEMYEKGAFWMLEEGSLQSEILLSKIKELLENTVCRTKLTSHMKELSILDSSEIIYNQIKEMIQ